MQLLFWWSRVAWLFLCLKLLVFQWRPTSALKTGFTIRVDSGKRECFFEEVKKNISLDVEYQVIEGGELDISFFLKLPSGELAIEDHKKTDETHSIMTTEAGVYEFCLDNTFSTVASKTVFADFGVDFDDEQGEKVKELNDKLEEGMETNAFVDNLERIRVSLDKAQHIQNFLRTAEARDYKLVKSNLNRVFWWSLIQSTTLIAVAFVQVTIVKQFFGGGKYTARV